MLLYLPILEGPYSAACPTDWINETPLMALTRENVVKDILDGQIEPPPARILEINLVAGTVKDVTKEIAAAVGERSLTEELTPYRDLRDWLDQYGAEYREVYERPLRASIYESYRRSMAAE